MFVIASQNILYLLIATLIGAIIGYILGKSHCQKKVSTKKETSTATNPEVSNLTPSEKLDIEEKSIVPKVQKGKEEIQEESIEERPVLLTEPRAEGKDNLQLIKGIGKVIEKSLNDTGVFHFDQLANLTENETNWLDKAISYPGRIKREKWIEQAKDLNERLTHDNPKD